MRALRRATARCRGGSRRAGASVAQLAGRGERAGFDQASARRSGASKALRLRLGHASPCSSSQSRAAWPRSAASSVRRCANGSACADRMQPAEEAAEPLQHLRVVELRSAAGVARRRPRSDASRRRRSDAKRGGSPAVQRGDRCVVVAQQRIGATTGISCCGEFAARSVLFEDLRVGPARRAGRTSRTTTAPSSRNTWNTRFSYELSCSSRPSPRRPTPSQRVEHALRRQVARRGGASGRRIGAHARRAVSVASVARVAGRLDHHGAGGVRSVARWAARSRGPVDARSTRRDARCRPACRTRWCADVDRAVVGREEGILEEARVLPQRGALAAALDDA